MSLYEEYIQGNIKYILLLLAVVFIGSMLVVLASAMGLASAMASLALLLLLNAVIWGIIAFVGYAHAKKKGGGVREGAVVGAIVAIISGFLSRIIIVLLLVPLVTAITATSLQGNAGAGQAIAAITSMLAIFSIFGIIFGFITDSIVGMLFGAIGGALAPREKEDFSSQSKLFGGE